MDDVLCDTSDDICTITLNKPDRRNAVDGPMAAELHRAFETFEDDPALKIAILTGAGDSFCAGADLSVLDDPVRRNELDPSGGGVARWGRPG